MVRLKICKCGHNAMRHAARHDEDQTKTVRKWCTVVGCNCTKFNFGSFALT